MNSSSLTHSNWLSNVGESMSSPRRRMTSSLVMLRTSFAMRSVSMLDQWLMISVLAASAAAATSLLSEDQLVWLGSRQSPQVLWCLSHFIWKRRCTYCLQQGSWTLRSQVSDFRWHTKHSYSLVTTSGSSCFSLLLCRSAILFLHKYKIYNKDSDERHCFFMTCTIPLSFSSSSCRLVGCCFTLFTHAKGLWRMRLRAMKVFLCIAHLSPLTCGILGGYPHPPVC